MAPVPRRAGLGPSSALWEGPANPRPRGFGPSDEGTKTRRMVFASHAFLVFMAALFAVYFAALRWWPQACKGVLIAASLFFYGYWEPAYLILFGVSLAGNFLLGRRLAALGGAAPARLLLTIGITANVCAIAYYKYAAFIAGSINAVLATELPILAIVLPIGISFFTFQQIAYLVDEYRGRVGELTFPDYVLFVAFFPQLIAGPIVQQSDLVPQIRARADWSLRVDQIALGMAIFAIGLFKKTVIIDPFTPYIDAIYTAAAQGRPVGMLDAWIAGFGYSFQVYFDFSAYSDMAVGLGLMFGFRMPFNFFSPFKAPSISECWRRWHITLSRFLRECIYIPLGGSRRGLPVQVGALVATMTIGGLWHGAGWTYVFWGFLHGVALGVNVLFARARLALFPDGVANIWLKRVLLGLSVLLTFTFFSLSLVIFRAHDWASAMALAQAAIGLSPHASISDIGRGIAPLFPVYLFIVWCLPNTLEIFRHQRPALHMDEFISDYDKPRWYDGLITFTWSVRWAISSAVTFVVAWFALSNLSPFIYFQF